MNRKSKIRELAHLELELDESIPEDDFEEWVDALAAEFDAALADRLIEWKDARAEGWPLRKPLVERTGS